MSPLRWCRWREGGSLGRRLALCSLAVLIGALLFSSASAHESEFGTVMTFSDTQPLGVSGSVENWVGATFDADNIGGSGINADGGSDNGAANDVYTYVANNQPVQGQSFQTGGHADGYQLHSITVQATGYTNNSATGGNQSFWDLNEHAGPILLTLVEISGTTRTTIVRYTFMGGGDGSPGFGSSANGSGKYITFEMPSTTYLDPNATYGLEISIGNGSSNHFEWLGSKNDNYGSGTAYSREWWGGPLTSHAGDRVFLADMSALDAPAPTFAHPGTLHSQSDLDLMATKVAAGEEPWLSGYNKLLSSPYNNLGWPAYDVDYIVRDGPSPNNYTRSQLDAQLIYTLTMIWHLTGDAAYADRAVYIANTWSDLIGIQGNSNSSLAAGICGYLFAVGGDLLSTYSGWQAADQQAYKDMMMRVFYPANLDFLWRQHDTVWRDGGNTHYRLNWVTANMASMAAIGILCDNRAVYEQAVDFFKYGSSNGRVERAAWYVHPSGLAQGEEAGRDQGHNMGGWHAMALLCQMAWNQGDDLFGYDNNRVLRAFEYNAKYNLWNDVDYARHRNATLGYTEGGVSGVGRGIYQYYHYELVYNHYANVKGVAAPWSEQAASVTRPEPWSDAGVHPSQADWFGLGTLTYSKEPALSGVAPSNLVGHWSQNQITVNWNGTAGATSYDIQRATTSGGPYTTIGSVESNDLYYIDSSVTNGTSFYYVVTAHTPSGSLDSPELEVSQKLVTHYTFEGSANDQIGSRNAELFVGSGTVLGYASGHGGGQAIELDGLDDYVKMPVGTANHQDITLAAWVYWDGGSSWQRVFDFGSEIEKTLYLTPSNGGGVIELGFTTTRGGHFVGDASYYLTGATMPVGAWTHLAFTLNGDIMSLYVNGELVDTEFNDLIDPLHGQPFCYLGRSMYNSDPHFNGRIDDFRIYNYALSSEELTSLSGGGGTGSAPSFSGDTITKSNATEDAAYSDTFVVDVSDPDNDPLTFIKLWGPAWISVAANGDLTGTPGNDEVGLSTLAVRVIDGNGNADEAIVDITVLNANDAPTWNSDPITFINGHSSQSYIGSVGAYVSDIDVGDTWTFSKVSGPSWLIVASDGSLSGTPSPSDTGLNIFTVRVADLLGATADATVNISVDLIARYGFEGDVNDASGLFDGAETGSPAYSSGQYGQAVDLDGADDYLTLPSGVANLNDFTIATWVHWDGGSSWQRIFDFGSNTSEYMYLTPSNGGNMRFGIKAGGFEQGLDTAPMPTGEWVHVAVILEGGVGTLYVNGAPVVVNSGMTLKPSAFNPWSNYIGNSQWPDPLFDGRIDDFRIYNYGLTGAEVTDVLLGGSPGDGLDVTPPATPASLIANAGDSSVSLGWAGSTENDLASYTVYRSTTSGSGFAPIASGLSSSAYTDNNLSNGTTYYYVVTATDVSANESASSLEVSATPVPAPVSIPLPNGDFELSTQENYPTGFDSPYDVPGWMDLTSSDSGVENVAWWGTYDNYSAFMKAGDGAYLMSQYTIQNGDVFSVGFVGKSWDASSEWTVTLFYDNPANVIGTYVQSVDGTWTEYSHGAIQATAGSIGGTLGVSFVNTGSGFANLDNVSLAVLGETPPAAPTGLVATPIFDDEIDLSWNASDGAISYVVNRSTSIGGPYTTIASGVTQTSFSDSALSAYTTYYYVINAANDGGESADSIEASATTESIPIADEEIRRLRFSIESFDPEGQPEELTLSMESSVPGHFYQIQYSTDLTSESWEDFGVMQGGTGSLLEFSVSLPADPPRQFFRVKVAR